MYKGRITGLGLFAYAEQLMRENKKTHWPDSKLDKLMAKEFPDVKLALMNAYRCNLRRIDIDLPRYDKHSKKYCKPMKGFEAFLFALFEKYGAKPRTVAFYAKQIEEKFPAHGYSIAGLVGAHNSGRRSKPPHQVKILGIDGVIRTPYEEARRVTGEINSNVHKGMKASHETRKKMSKAQKKRYEDNPEWLQQFVHFGQEALRRPQPGRMELYVFSLLDDWFLKTFKSTGDTRVGKNYIGSRCPDFTSNGIVVEFDGNGHVAFRKKRKITEQQDVAIRRRHYQKHGYLMFVIFDRDLKDLPKLRRRIKRFIGGYR